MDEVKRQPTRAPKSRHTASAAADSGLTLATIVQQLGQDVVRVLDAPNGLNVAVRGLEIYDPAAPSPPGEGDLILAVGIPLSSAGRLLVEAGRTGASAVCFKVDPEETIELPATSQGNCAVLAIPRDLPWQRLHKLFDVVSTMVRSAGAAGAMNVRVGDLYSLANALAATLGCQVVIDNENLQNIAHSGVEGADQLRRESILIRKIPDQWLERMRKHGIIRRLWQGQEIVRFPAWKDLSPPATHPRAGIAIRAGEEVLGVIFVEEVKPLGAAGDAALREAARVAALHLIRNRVGNETHDLIRASMARTLLQGHVLRSEPATQLGWTHTTVGSVTAFALAVEPHHVDAHVVVDLTPIVQLRFSMYYPEVTVTTMGRRLYALVAMYAKSGQRQSMQRAANEVIDLARARRATALKAGIGSVVSMSDLPRSRRDADMALDVALSEPDLKVASIDEYRGRAVMGELADLARERPSLLEGKISVLLRSDNRADQRTLDTLRVFLASNCDIPTAARRTKVHPNTFRYRVERALATTGLDIRDPTDRLVTELQLNLAAQLDNRDRKLAVASRARNGRKP